MKSLNLDTPRNGFEYMLLMSLHNMGFYAEMTNCMIFQLLSKARCEKTGLRGFRPGLTQTGLYSL